MVKFIVTLYKRHDLSEEQFFSYFREIHGPLAEKIPGLTRYVQNFVQPDPKREHPGWSIISELYFENLESMEEAWRSDEGRRASDDLENFVDPEASSWSVVEEVVAIR